MDEDFEIDTLGQLMRAVSQATFGGYKDALEVSVKQEHSNGGFLIITVTATTEADAEVIEQYVGYRFLGGEYWFDEDDRVMQVM